MRTLRSKSLGCVLMLLVVACGGSTPKPKAANGDDALLGASEREVPEASALVREGEAKLAANDAQAARSSFERALEQDPRDARAALDLGIACEMLDDLEGAERAYNRAVEIQPDFAEALNNLGVLKRDGGDLDAAIALLERATGANPSSAAAFANLALAHEDRGDLEGARKAYARSLEIAPRDAMTRANYGLLLLRVDDTASAKRELSRALADAAGHRAALLAVGNGLRRAGDAGGALEAMQAAVDAGETPASSALLSELALAQRAAGQSDAARKTLEDVIARDDKYATAHYLLATMLAADKHYAEAKKHYQRYLKLEPKGEHAERAKERLAVVEKLD